MPRSQIFLLFLLYYGISPWNYLLSKLFVISNSMFLTSISPISHSFIHSLIQQHLAHTYLCQAMFQHWVWIQASYFLILIPTPLDLTFFLSRVGMSLRVRAGLKEFRENQTPWWGKVPCTFRMKASFCFWEECSWLPHGRTRWPPYKSPWGQGASACLLPQEWTPSHGGPDEQGYTQWSPRPSSYHILQS